MQVANAFANLIEQLDGPGRYPVGFVGSVKPVHPYSIALYWGDFKHFLGEMSDFVKRRRLWISDFLSFKSKLGPFATHECNADCRVK